MNIKRVCILLGLLYFSIQILVSSCANISSPTGGPKDTIPPKLVDIHPKPGALRFNEKEIRLEFNEGIQLKDLKNQLIITPSYEGEYKTKQIKNGVELIFEEEFAENTTYTFAFREAIGDLNEGNPVKNLKLAFSTGDYMDSLSINGRIRNIMTGKPVEDALVSLYRAHDTLTLFNSRPYYLAKTNKEGYYQFDNLKNGEYLIYAVKDANKNLKADSRTEPFGFIKDTINLQSNIDSLHINLLRLNTEPVMINNSRPTSHYYIITLNKGVLNYELAPLDTTVEKLSSNLVEENKKVRIYNTFAIADSLATLFTAKDSLGQQVQDTVYIRFDESKRPKEEFTTAVEPKGGATIPEDFKATISFSKPVKHINLDSLYFRYDSLTLVRPDTIGNFTWNTQGDKLTIHAKLDASLANKPREEVAAKEESLQPESQQLQAEAGQAAPSNEAGPTGNEEPEAEEPEQLATAEEDAEHLEQDELQEDLQDAEPANNQPQAGQRAPNTKRPASGDQKPKNNAVGKNMVEFYAGKGAFVGVENDSSTVQQLKYSFAESKNFGIIEGNFNTKAEYFTIQLLQANNFSVVKELRDQKNFQFRLVPPGEYRLRVMVDTNGNGRWDPGNIHERIEPEPVLIFEDKIILKANWELKDIQISE